MDQHTYDFYQNLRYRIREWLRSKNGLADKRAEYVMLAPDLFHLLCKLATDKEMPVTERAKLGAAAGYFVEHPSVWCRRRSYVSLVLRMTWHWLPVY
jgi:hypothetical protein